MAEQTNPFGVGIGELFGKSIRALRSNPQALLATTVATFGAYAGFRYLASQAETALGAVGFDLAGLVVSSVVALPWYRAALDAADGKASDPAELIAQFRWFKDQTVASIFFWAGILFGLRYLLGLPSIFVVVMYAFYGFIVTERTDPGGLRALGASVVLGQGRRIGIGAIGALLLIMNLFGAIAIGFEELNSTLQLALAIAGLIVTTNISMLVGAHLYRHVSTNAIERTTTKGKK